MIIRCCDESQPERWTEYYHADLALAGVDRAHYTIEHQPSLHHNTEGKLITGQYGHVVVTFLNEEAFARYQAHLGPNLRPATFR